MERCPADSYKRRKSQVANQRGGIRKSFQLHLGRLRKRLTEDRSKVRALYRGNVI